MRPVSAAFLRSLPGSHKIVSRAIVCDVFQTGVSPVGTEVGIVDGTVTLDGRAEIRTTCDINVNAAWPIRQSDLLAPYGHEVFIQTGIEYDPGNVEYVSLGYLRIDTITDEVDAQGPITRVTGFDRMKGIMEGRLLAPRQFLSGDSLGFIVEQLVQEVYPTAVIEWDDNTDLSELSRSIIVDDDRYAFLNDAITSQGKIWYWDHRGILVIKSVPDPTVPVYSVVHGTNGTLVQTGRQLTREDSFNAVVALGEGGDSEQPVRGIALDNDPDSPTYFFGPFGQVPRFYSSPFIGTTQQADGAALGILTKELGLPYTANFGNVSNPALEPYDPVEVKFSHSEAKTTHILDTIDVPLGIGSPQTATTRERRITLVGA